MAKIKGIGILCEDKSDFDCIKIIIKRILNNEKITIDGYYSGGCSLLRRKAYAHSDLLKKRGCNMLIIVHDLDQKSIKELKLDIENIGCGKLFSNYLICIPIREIEAWLLSDPSALKKSLNLKKLPKTPPSPELIDSPKEHLEKLIYRTSNNEKRYLNTVDNHKIAKLISISLLEKKCSSFYELYVFLKTKEFSY